MADNNAQGQEPPKDKKKRKSNLKKSDPAPKEESPTAAPATPESRKASLAPPPSAPESRKASLAPPPSAPESRKTSLVPPSATPEEGQAPSTKRGSLPQPQGPTAAPDAPESRKASLVPPPAAPEEGQAPSEAPSRSSSTKRGSLPQPQSAIRRTSEMRGSRKAVSLLEDLDEAKLLELKEAFKLFDMDQDGFISGVDLKQTFGTLGKTDVTDEEIRQMLSEASNPLDFDAFVMLLGFKTISLDPEEILLDALGKWDKNNSGFIQEERIKHDLMTWGDKFTSAEVDVALEDAPTFVTDGQHMIDYVKFCKLLCGLRKKTKDVTIEDFMT